ncbi:reverse transcriptase [Advenella kashmirensis W13003]|uniref:Reverse transcriptase n=1 Tax=Advenella kashmirensis W13003 TaxID=1424334 RepID=V8QKV7_9BURK|nr:RNA-directed DNA polymerase [Advenella kashmirensis]ETF00571.1 reverse transcriptase [Advenella kashmirensis W13003]
MTLKLSEEALNWALKHAINYSDTDIFPKAFEFSAIADGWADVKTTLQETDILKWTVRAYRRCLVPKNSFGFRISTQLDPLDFIVFTALVWEVGGRLERQRIPAIENIVHAYRFSPADDGRMYSTEYSYRSFQASTQELCERVKPEFVVVADIADFFPRIYGHRVDNALESALGVGHMHAKALKNLISHWAVTYSYGIPVGSAASRLIAELTIGDVDQVLLSEGIQYVRYSDDFRIFSKSKGEAYQALTLLARTLYDNHGLTLQQNKTKILPVEHFRYIYLRENEKKEIETLSEQFYELLREIGIEDTYDSIEFDTLTAEHQQRLLDLNLVSILTEQVAQDEPDLSLLKFLLRRLGQVGSTEPIDIIFDNLDAFVPVVRETVEYLLRLESLSDERKRLLGYKLLSSCKDPTSTASSLEYTRMYLLHPFAEDGGWNSADQYVRAYNESPDEFGSRELLLAMGRSSQHYWIRSRKQYLNTLSPWLRRAYIYAASCLPTDEYKHWIRGIQAQLDPIERAVAEWARKNPINTSQ